MIMTDRQPARLAAVIALAFTQLKPVVNIRQYPGLIIRRSWVRAPPAPLFESASQGLVTCEYV